MRSDPFDRALHMTHNLVERSIDRLKQFRRITTKYEQEAENCLAMPQIGTILARP